MPVESPAQRRALRCLRLLAVALAWPAAHAQDATRIVAATVYPDSASVERALAVPGGTRHITIACVPASVDVSTLQVDGDVELQVGDIRATPLPASRTDDCAPALAQTQRKELAIQRSSLEAQRESNELALSYLKQWGTRAAADTDAPAPLPAPTRASAAANRPGATAGDLRHAALDLLGDQARVRRELEALERAEARLGDDQPVTRGKQGWRTVRFDVWTPAAAHLRVRYSVANTYWRPTYRASVDVAGASLRIDRQADIVQASGEDWSDVKVKLSTGRANRKAAADKPPSWWVDLVVAVANSMDRASPIVAAPVMSAPPPRMAKAMAGSSEPLAESEAPPWAVEVVRSETMTEFVIARPVTLASDGETHTLAIASQTLPVTLARRTTPRTDRAVYLLAQAARPAGVWPAGPLQSLRDGTLVGRSLWDPMQGDHLEIALGQDDQMRVDVESPGDFTSAKGLFNGTTEKSSKAVYAIVNQHAGVVKIEVLDAAPVSRSDQVTVRHVYDPAPAATDWEQRAGVAEWMLTVPGQQTQRVSVTHVVAYPKDGRVANLP